MISFIVDTTESCDLYFESGFLLGFTNDSFPRRFSDIESSSWEIPDMHIIAQAEEYAILVIPDHRKGSKRKSVFHVFLYVRRVLFSKNFVPKIEGK
jgi:hypothetical protein